MDSILSVEIPLRSIQELGDAPPPTAPLEPDIVGDSVWRLALLESGDQSIYIAVPRAFISVPSVAIFLIVKDFAVVRLGFAICPPGNS